MKALQKKKHIHEQKKESRQGNISFGFGFAHPMCQPRMTSIIAQISIVAPILYMIHTTKIEKGWEKEREAKKKRNWVSEIEHWNQRSCIN